MIIQKGEGKKGSFWFILIPLFLIFSIGLYVLVSSLKVEKISHFEQTFKTIICTAESASEKDFVTDNTKYFNGKTQSKDFAYDGKYSSKVDPKSKYAMGKAFTDYFEGQLFIVEVWVKADKVSNCYIVAQGNKESEFYKSSNKSIEVDEFWEKIVLEFEIPNTQNLTELKIYGFYTGNSGIAYFDNLKIRYSAPETNSPVVDSFETASLYLDTEALGTIKQKRKKALQLGILEAEEDDWVKGKWTDKTGEQTEIELRLKGDWTDHLKGKDWSFRIKFPADKTWNRIRTFSIQHPKTRYYLSEWLFHEALWSQDVITPRYDFFLFKQNGDNPKLYAYEEHFEKQIAEFRNRREGVIIRFSEDGFWESRIRDKKFDTKLASSFSHNNAGIYPFKQKKATQSDNLKEQLEYAQNLLFSYQYDQISIDLVFDVDKLARYFAICEVFEAHHSFIWHNQRFYYNPITRLLEPIGFDGFTETGAYTFTNFPFFGAFINQKKKNPWSSYYQKIFSNKEFAEKYYKYLLEFSNPIWMQKFVADRKSEITYRKRALETSYPEYTFETESLFEVPKRIHSAIHPLEKFDVRVFESDSTWSVSNYFSLPIEVIGSCKSKKSIKYFSDPILISSTWKDNIPLYDRLQKVEGKRYLVWRILGEQNRNHFVEIKKWNRPEVESAQNKIKEIQIPIDKSNYRIKDQIVSIKAGTYNLTSPLIIPKDYKLIIQSGVNINLANKAYVLIYGGLEILGSKNRRVNIYSENKDSQGFHVIANQEKAILNNVHFDNLSNLSQDEWQLTGSVTLYETDVKINNVTISNNDCEDALNIIRSKIDITFLNINNTFADGFDCDFCKGFIRNSVLHNTGNDGLDFSGSQLTLDKITMSNIGDKGISAGEEATLNVRSVDIDGAAIGIASKDLSLVKVDYLNLKNCNKGFAAYQKKPEFGLARIRVKNYSEQNVKTLILKEDKSEIIFEK